jgi:SAM-dependent methyltransferase
VPRPSPSAALTGLLSRGAAAAGGVRRHTRATRVVADLLRGRPPATPLEPGTPVTDVLHARLQAGDRAGIVALMAGSAATMHAGCGEAARKRLELAHAVAFGPDAARGRLGLLGDTPPEAVHSMARDWTSTGGDTYLADLVVSAFGAAGCPLPTGGTVLDFGCSSGRVLRVLASVRPDVRCLGCDPNAAAVGWAAAHLPGEYVVSPQDPPLELGAASVDGVYAVSVWTHFAEPPAAAWLAEMARIVRPGGALVLTTHSWDALVAFERRGMIDRFVVGATAEALMTHGHHFVDVFGPDGDWGVRDAGWGDAYATADWLTAQVTGAWSVELRWPGAIDGAQDLFVLRRR